jgi:hypothetical protein
MMEEDFYATLKLKTGEEIFAKVAASEENEKTMLILSNPVMIGEIKSKSNVVGYKVEPWIKTSTEDMFIININDVLTMTESSDIEMIMMHQSFVRSVDKESSNSYQIDRKMGYIGNVNDTKEILEKLYKNS